MPLPRGNRRTACHNPSPIRSSVISHRHGIGWRRDIAATIAQQMQADDRLAAIRDRIAHSAKIARREPADITLIAVSKTHPAETIEPLMMAGHRDFGENRVAEAEEKWPALRERFPDTRLHLIGQLQSNKASEAVAIADAIHAVDRPSLIAALAKAMDAQDRRPDCFIQVNIGDEPQKGGCTISALPALLTEARAASLPIVGLMCLPPAGVDSAPYFALLAKIARDHGIGGLSMGMSDDFETAVTIGATHVRIGSALFGERA